MLPLTLMHDRIMSEKSIISYDIETKQDYIILFNDHWMHIASSRQDTPTLLYITVLVLIKSSVTISSRLCSLFSNI